MKNWGLYTFITSTAYSLHYFTSEFRLPLQVVHLLLGPHADNLARVLFPEASLETIVVLDVAISVLEFVQCGLEDLHRTLRW